MQVKKLMAYKSAVESLRASTDALITKDGIEYSFAGRCGSRPQIEFRKTDSMATTVSNGRYRLELHPEGELIPFQIIAPAFASLEEIMPNAMMNGVGDLVRAKITHANQEPQNIGRFAALTTSANQIAEEAQASGRATSAYWLLAEVESGLRVRRHEFLKLWQKIVVITTDKKLVVCVHTDDYFGGMLDAIYEVDRDDVVQQSDEPAVVA